MKAIKNSIFAYPLFLFLLLAGNLVSHAQENGKPTEQEERTAIKSLVDEKNFIFQAQSVIPMRGRSRQLTSEYDVKVFNDTLHVYLPYFGRSYTAPINPSEGGLQFTSTSFDYEVQPRKKGRWEVVIKPKDVTEVRQLQLSVSESGYASLQVLSNNRDPISFNGIVAKRTQK